ncbi:hypothetical protein BOX15_Mlig028149g2, partial [Macrostomum lignano]
LFVKMSNNLHLLTPTAYDHNYTIGSGGQILLVKEAKSQKQKKKFSNPQHLLRGVLKHGELLPKPCVVRICFVSADGQDSEFVSQMIASCQSELAEYCRRRSFGPPLNLTLIDLSSGVGCSELDDHSLASVRRDELRRCLRQSRGPAICWATVGGPGNEEAEAFRAPPESVPQSVLDQLARVMNAGDEDRLRRWYQLDENAQPAQYCLLPVSSRHPEYLSADVRAAAAAAAAWRSEAAALLTSMRAAAAAIAGLGGLPTAWATGAAFEDADRDALESFDDSALLRCSTAEEFLFSARSRIEFAQQQAVQPVVPPLLIEAAAGHLRVRRRLLRMAAISCEDADQDGADFDKDFSSWRQARRAVMEYAASAGASTAPLLVVGPPGVGKSTLLADASTRLTMVAKDSTVVLFRLAGSDSELGCCGGIVRSLLRQLRGVYGDEGFAGEDEIKELSDSQLFSHLAACLGRLSSLHLLPHGHRLGIFVAGLDRLEGSLSSLAWLPAQLPSNVRIVSSCSAETASDWGCSCQSVLRLTDPTSKLEIERTAVRLLASGWRGRRLRAGQLAVALSSVLGNEVESSCRCGVALRLRLAMAGASAWRSDFKVGRSELEDGSCPVRRLMERALERLERRFGSRPVGEALAAVTYLTEIGGGISESELMAFLADVQSSCSNVQLWWARLRRDARGYLVTLGEDAGVPLIAWCHPALTAVAADRYLCSQETDRLIDRLCEAVSSCSPSNRYYRLIPMLLSERLRSWLWSAEEPMKCGSGCVSARISSAKSNLADKAANLHQSELLLQAYKSKVCFNLDWLVSKQRALGLRALLEDCRIAARRDFESERLFEVLASILAAATPGDAQRLSLPAELLARCDAVAVEGLWTMRLVQDARMAAASEGHFVEGDEAAMVPLNACVPVTSVQDGLQLMSALDGYRVVSRVICASSDGRSVVVLTSTPSASSFTATDALEIWEPDVDRLLGRLTTRAETLSTEMDNGGFFVCPNSDSIVTLSGDCGLLTVWDVKSARPLLRRLLEVDNRREIDEIDDKQKTDEIDEDLETDRADSCRKFPSEESLPAKQQFGLIASDFAGRLSILLRLPVEDELLVVDAESANPIQSCALRNRDFPVPAGACFVDSRTCLIAWTAASDSASLCLELASLTSSASELEAFAVDRIFLEQPDSDCFQGLLKLVPMTTGQGNDAIVKSAIVCPDCRPAFYLIDRIRPLRFAGNGRLFDWTDASSATVAMETLVTENRIYFVCEKSIRFESIGKLTGGRRARAERIDFGSAEPARCGQVDRQDRILFVGFLSEVQAWSVDRRTLLRTFPTVGEVLSLALPLTSLAVLFGVVSRDCGRVLTSWGVGGLIGDLGDENPSNWWSADPAVAAHPLDAGVQGGQSSESVVVVIHQPAGVAAYWQVSREAASMSSATDMLAEQNGASPSSRAPVGKRSHLRLIGVAILVSEQQPLAALLVKEAVEDDCDSAKAAVVVFHLLKRRRMTSKRRLSAGLRWIRATGSHLALIEAAGGARRCHLYELGAGDGGQALQLVQTVDFPGAGLGAAKQVTAPELVLSPDSRHAISLNSLHSFSVWSLVDARGDRAAKGSAVPLKSGIASAGGISSEDCVQFFADSEAAAVIGLRSGDLLAFQPLDAYRVAAVLPTALKASSVAATTSKTRTINRRKFLTVALGAHSSAAGGVASVRCLRDCLVATCGADGRAGFWRWLPEDAQFDCLMRLEAGESPMACLDTAAEAGISVTASLDGTLRIWQGAKPLCRFQTAGAAKLVRLLAGSSAAVVLLQSGRFASFGLARRPSDDE